MKITVTSEDIENAIKYFGKKDICSSCPISLAIQRAVKHTNVRVYSHYICVGKFNELISAPSYDLPSKAVQFIKNFDKNLKVKPFSFEVKIK